MILFVIKVLQINSLKTVDLSVGQSREWLCYIFENFINLFVEIVFV